MRFILIFMLFLNPVYAWEITIPQILIANYFLGYGVLYSILNLLDGEKMMWKSGSCLSNESKHCYLGDHTRSARPIPMYRCLQENENLLKNSSSIQQYFQDITRLESDFHAVKIHAQKISDWVMFELFSSLLIAPWLYYLIQEKWVKKPEPF